MNDAILLGAREVGKDMLGSLDATHLASALAVGAGTLVTYADRLANSGVAVGLSVLAPTA